MLKHFVDGPTVIILTYRKRLGLPVESAVDVQPGHTASMPCVGRPQLQIIQWRKPDQEDSSISRWRPNPTFDTILGTFPGSLASCASIRALLLAMFILKIAVLANPRA